MLFTGLRRTDREEEADRPFKYIFYITVIRLILPKNVRKYNKSEHLCERRSGRGQLQHSVSVINLFKSVCFPPVSYSEKN